MANRRRNRSKIKMDPYLSEWTCDEVAEALDGVSGATSSRLWSLAESADNRTPLGGDPGEQPGTVETPEERLGDFGDKLSNVWHLLTEEEQREINAAAKAARERRDSYGV